MPLEAGPPRATRQGTPSQRREIVLPSDGLGLGTRRFGFADVGGLNRGDNTRAEREVSGHDVSGPRTQLHHLPQRRPPCRDAVRRHRQRSPSHQGFEQGRAVLGLTGESNRVFGRALGHDGIAQALLDREASEDAASCRIVVDNRQRSREQLLRIRTRDAGERRPTRCGRAHDLQRERVVVRRERDAHCLLQRVDAAWVTGKLLCLREISQHRSAIRALGEILEGEIEPPHSRTRLVDPE